MWSYQYRTALKVTQTQSTTYLGGGCGGRALDIVKIPYPVYVLSIQKLT